MEWEDGGSTTESTRGICLLHVFGKLKEGKGPMKYVRMMNALEDDSEDEGEKVYNSDEPQPYTRYYCT